MLVLSLQTDRKQYKQEYEGKFLRYDFVEDKPATNTQATMYSS